MSPRKKSRKKKANRTAARRKNTRPKQKTVGKKTVKKKKMLSKKKASVRGKSETVDTVVFDPKGLGPRSGGQSGDLQGLSELESAGSESVGELLEEGNAYEAEVVKGVEDVPDADEEEVTTREVPEDDIPEEYRNER